MSPGCGTGGNWRNQSRCYTFRTMVRCFAELPLGIKTMSVRPNASLIRTDDAQARRQLLALTWVIVRSGQRDAGDLGQLAEPRNSAAASCAASFDGAETDTGHPPKAPTMALVGARR